MRKETTTKEFKKLLRTLKEYAARHTPDSSWKSENRATLLMQIKNTMHEEYVYAKNPRQLWNTTAIFFKSFIPMVPRAVSRPLFVGTLVMVFGFSWIASVNASYSSVPGDILYPLKIVTENAQLSLASGDERTKLRVEFAGRRVDEVVRISENTFTKTDARATQAMANLEQTLQTVQVELDNLKKDPKRGNAVALAKTVDRKIDTYRQVLGKTQKKLSPGVQAIAISVKNLADATETKAVEVIVEKHAAGMASKDEVVEKLQEKIVSVEAQVGAVKEIQKTQDATAAYNQIQEAKRLLVEGDYSGALSKVVATKEIVKSTEEQDVASSTTKTIEFSATIATSTIEVVKPVGTVIVTSTVSSTSRGLQLKIEIQPTP